MYLSDHFRIWARGYPLSWLDSQNEGKSNWTNDTTKVALVNFLVDGEPDIDAIIRLVVKNTSDFAAERDFLPAFSFNNYHPFNSQATLWKRKFFPLMYLPVTCSFRMTDIWRGYIAQRIIFEYGYGIVFEEPAVYQNRNNHRISSDFFSEHLGYIQSEQIINILKNVELNSKMKMTDCLLDCYTALVRNDIFEEDEIKFLNSWIKDVED